MSNKGQQTRQQIIEQANTLFYTRGFNQTSFADIAAAVNIPKGNIYYYFKTKDEVLQTVIAQRIADAREMLTEWTDSIGEPLERLRRYAQVLINEKQGILRYGCPMGSLTVELSKTQLQQQSQVIEMMELFRDFLQQQFQALGYDEQEAQMHSMHLLAWTQGVSLMSNAYKNPQFLQNEVVKIKAWLDNLVSRDMSN